MQAVIEHISSLFQELTNAEIVESTPSQEVQNYPEENTSVWSFYFSSRTNSNNR